MSKHHADENVRVAIELPEDAEDALVGFPFREGQYIAEEYDAEDGRNTKFVDIELGDRKDTDAAQEQWLNTNPQVINYSIR